MKLVIQDGSLEARAWFENRQLHVVAGYWVRWSKIVVALEALGWGMDAGEQYQMFGEPRDYVFGLPKFKHPGARIQAKTMGVLATEFSRQLSAIG